MVAANDGDAAAAGAGTPGCRPAAVEGSTRPVRLGRLLTVLLLAGATQRLILLTDYVTNNPFSLRPISDAAVYWDWAGRIADGQLTEPEPFFAAPLYAYILAPLRRLGGGLVAAYAFNSVLDLSAAALLARWARRRAGDAAGLLASGLFLLMLEPASFSLRTLPISVQMLLVAAAALSLEAALRRGRALHGLNAGAALGLLALAYPAALALLPLAVALGGGAARSRRRSTALGILAGGVLTVGPAALHNWHASGELIPVAAHAGITFAHGNNARAAGTYTPERGVSTIREYQNLDARREVEQALDRPASWSEVNRHFFRRGLEFWQTHPRQAARLLLRKLYWFATGLQYGDIYSPLAERREGLLRSLWLAPLHTAWLMPMALLALARWSRTPARYAPELLLFLLPALVALVFFYSPRYRAPVLPLLAVAAGEEIAAAWTSRRMRRAVLPTAALGIGLALPALNRVSGFDEPGPPPGEFWCDVAYVLQTSRRVREATAAYEKGLALAPCQPRALAALSLLWMERGEAEPAEVYARRAIDCDPNHVLGHNQLAAVLVMQERYEEALAQARISVQLDPDSAAAHTRLAVALVALGRPADGLAALRHAHDLSPRDPVIAANLAWLLAALPDLPAADRQLAVALAEQAVTATRRQTIRPLATLAAAYAANERFTEAIRAVDEALELARQQGNATEVRALIDQRRQYEAQQP